MAESPNKPRTHSHLNQTWKDALRWELGIYDEPGGERKALQKQTAPDLRCRLNHWQP